MNAFVRRVTKPMGSHATTKNGQKILQVIPTKTFTIRISFGYILFTILIRIHDFMHSLIVRNTAFRWFLII